MSPATYRTILRLAPWTEGCTAPAAVNRGFSLVEVLVAMTVMMIATIGLAQLSVMAIRVNQGARATTFTTVLASQKMEQLRALAWTWDPSGAAISDASTDTAVAPERSSGGTGLTASPPDALRVITPGYCDYLDAAGRTLGGGPTPPSKTAFIRRWSIEPLPFPGNDTLAIQVSVTPLGSLLNRSNARLPGEARIFSIKTRKGT